MNIGWCLCFSFVLFSASSLVLSAMLKRVSRVTLLGSVLNSTVAVAFTSGQRPSRMKWVLSIWRMVISGVWIIYFLSNPVTHPYSGGT